jgi:hypothetical protein
MPKGPRGEKRPGDVIGAAIMVAKIATGEIEDNADAPAAKKAKGEKAASRRRVGPKERKDQVRER